MSIILLKDILTIFGLSIIVIYACHRLRIPTIIGFLLTAVLAGSYGLCSKKGALVLSELTKYVERERSSVISVVIGNRQAPLPF